MAKRKGSRSITVEGREYTWMRGSAFTEIRDVETNKAVHVPNEELESFKVHAIPGIDCGIKTEVSTTPYNIIDYIRSNKILRA